MAIYNNNKSGDTLETIGSIYRITNGDYLRTVDLSKWTDNAEQWIDNDIKQGYYEGFVKQN